jgi:predicted nuclease of predicted toxin-antitoxin system
MRLKLDENLGTRTQRVFADAGHDVQTVRQESLEGSPDERIYAVCCAENRCLVTLDLDFADLLRFPPGDGAGIIVIRVPRNPSLQTLEMLARQTVFAMAEMSLEKHLWIVEVGRVRIRE